MAEPTFQKRVARAVTGLCLGLLVGAGIAVFVGAWFSLAQNRDLALLAIARAELASALDGPGGTIHIHDEEPTTLSLQRGVGYEKYAVIYNSQGQLVAHTTNARTGVTHLIDEKAIQAASQGQAVFANLAHESGGLRALYYSLKDLRGANYVSVCAIPDAPLRQALTLLALVIAGAVVVTGLAAVLLARALAYTLTRPLAAIAANAHQIGSQSLAERIASPSPDAEIRAVTDALNGMLNRLETAFATQQRFLLDASHELRSPLSNLKGTIEVALRRPRSTEEYRDMLQIALQETERLSRLATDLLLLSRADAGQISLAPTVCDLAEIAARAVRQHQPRADAQNIRLTLDGTPTRLQGDPDRLRQVIDNLLDNALRYAPPDSVVSVSVEREGPTCRLMVEDRGPGIAAEHLPHLFDRFYRADPSRTRASGGAGLGLTIVRSLVEAHRGEITVESDGQRGTRFIVRFPAWDADGAPSSNRGAKQPHSDHLRGPVSEEKQ